MIVQGNAHGYDNRVVLDALAATVRRVRGVAITDTRIAPATFRDWHRLGMRGLRFHAFSAAGRPGYVRGVGLDVFEIFRPVMRELGWVMQVWCDWRALPEVAGRLREISAEMPVVIDHMLNIPAARGIDDLAFQTLLRLVGEGHVHAKLSAPYRLSEAFPDYADARAFHDALVRANPERLLWGTDWPHPQIAAERHAGRRPSRRPVPCLDARSASPPAHPGRAHRRACSDGDFGQQPLLPGPAPPAHALISRRSSDGAAARGIGASFAWHGRCIETCP